MNGKYKATIITPFHNTDMSMFAETIKSVKNQTIGFSNIEWIIVLHNCKQEYVDSVKQLLGGYSNVILKELYNDAKSASSPRNYGLKFVTSPYIEFLDSDDSISPETVEKCVDVMGKHHPEIVIFRMAYIKENESVQSVITDITLWNPLEEEIVLTGERLRCEELFSSINFCTHNRFFDAEFIASNEICFDEMITMAEDAYFTLTCYSKAKKIVVLPQFIGHHYYVNSSSAVQNMDRSREKVLHFSYGFKKMFDLLISIHAYYNHFFLTVLAYYIQCAFCSPDFTVDDWKTLQNDMAPYAGILVKPPVNKFFNEEEGKLLYDFVTHTILNPIDERYQKYFHGGGKVLGSVIESNADTAFGKYYDFKNIKSIDEYRKRVPLTDDGKFNKILRLHTEVGETEIITKKKIKAYSYAINEYDERRMIPVSEDKCKEMGNKFINALNGEVTFLMMESRPKGMPQNDGTYCDSPIGIMVSSGIDAFTMSYRGFDGKLTAPFSIIFPSEPMNMDYLNLLMALRKKDVTQIYGSNTWVVLNYIEILIKQGEDLCRDIESGSISSISESGNQIYKQLEGYNYPDPERADEIRKVLKEGNKEKILRCIWPKLRRIIARSGGNYHIYTRKLRKYLGDIQLKFDDFLTPFGIIATQAGEDNVFRLDYEEGFYEFIPVDEVGSTVPLLLSETVTDRMYELVLTNCYGIYRMRTGIYLSPCKITKEEFQFNECMRPYYGDNRLICNAETFEKVLTECIGDNLYDYFCNFNTVEKCLDVYIELEKEDTDTDFSAALESQLLGISEYKKARECGIKECKVRVIDKETNLLWRDIRRMKYSAPADCFEPIHNINNMDQIPILKQWQDNGGAFGISDQK
ncbi:hypothetical protein BXO88_14760 [Oribacterium sp. C9]|uniref:GH3 family domain-containing protein n=1 Tax=Oribacterium sp. C9 TaxID=1943579 RepID=UPI000990128A|nr:GH3 auxin-responsive promoter family protein [Oribacterium sp. C9]OON84983.1 hypothetical protein BXO88_14760 [Oribacterium sp. C9]